MDAPAAPADAPADRDLVRILREARVIALVGASADPLRPSHIVGRYLSLRGYRVIPVNPAQAGTMLFGEPVRARLADIPPEDRVDMLDLFRNPAEAARIVAEAIAHLPHLRTVWMQPGAASAEAAAQAGARGLAVVADRCPKIEHQRLLGEPRMGGLATGGIAPRRPG